MIENNLHRSFLVHALKTDFLILRGQLRFSSANDHQLFVDLLQFQSKVAYYIGCWGNVAFILLCYFRV